MHAPPPGSEDELIRRVRALQGCRLDWIAGHLKIGVPPDLRRHKGWIGTLIEAALGASAGSKAEPDFPRLGIEMKTIPVRGDGAPKESTYVCTAPTDGSMAHQWVECWLRRKLSKVLWVPIHGDCEPGARTVGEALLWTPTSEQESLLRQDWEWMSELIALGEYWQIDARRGTVLQLRPKAANRDQLTWAQDAEGEWVRVQPRGFYLRARFTRQILAHRPRMGQGAPTGEPHATTEPSDGD